MSYESIKKAIQEARTNGYADVERVGTRKDEIKAHIIAARNTGYATVDENYINNLLPDVKQFISDAATNYDSLTYANAKDTYSGLMSNIDKYKSGLYLAKDYLKNNNPELYAFNEEYLSYMEKALEDIGTEYTNKNNVFSNYATADEYNAAVTKGKYADSTYDEILAEITRLGEEQKSQTPETAAETQKQRDTLNDLLYSNSYKDYQSYDKATADLDRQIAAVQSELDSIQDKRHLGNIASSIYDAENQSKSIELEKRLKQLKAQKTELGRNRNTLETGESLRQYGTVQDIPEFTEYSQKGSQMYTVDTSGTLKDIAESYEQERNKEGFNNQNLAAMFWNIVEKYPKLLEKGVSVYDLDNNIAPNTARNFDNFIKQMRGEIDVGGDGGLGFMADEDDYVFAQISVMNDTEKAIYNYLFAMNGIDTANDYLTKLSSVFYSDNLNKRKGEKDYAEIEGNTLKEILYGINFDQWEQDTLTWLGGNDSDYAMAPASQYTTQLVTDRLDDWGFKLPEWLGGASIGRVLFDLGNTTANMLPSVLTSMALGYILTPASAAGLKWSQLSKLQKFGVGAANIISQGTGSAMMGASASGNAYNEMISLGYDKNQAKTYATLVGVSEAGLQYLLGGISKLGGKLTGTGITKLAAKFDSTFAKAAIKLGGSMASEGLEEYLQEVLTPLMKNYAFYTDEQIDLLSPDALYAGLLGALSAGPMEVGGVASEAAYTNKYYGKVSKAAQQELVLRGLMLSEDCQAFKLAQKYAETAHSEKGLNAQQVRNLTEAVVEEINSNRETVVEAISEQLKQDGETGKVDKIANAIIDRISGVTLTAEQEQLLKNSKAGKSIVDELNAAKEMSEKFIKATQESEDISDTVSDIGFTGESSGVEYTVEQASVLAEIPSDLLWQAFGAVQESKGDISAKVAGITVGSELYKKLESAGLANSGGTINGTAVIDEVKRRVSEQKAKEEATEAKSSATMDSETDGNVDADIQYTDDEVVDSFDITDINDYVHVQKQVISTLKSEGFFTDEGGTSTTVTNANSGMVVEVNTGSMREAFNDKNFKRVSKTLKIAKLATIRDIPALIKNGTLVNDDVENIHKPEGNVKYAYIENNVLINGKPATIKIAIRKSPRKNKFWVHTIDIKNTDGSLLTRTKNGSEVSYQTSVDEDSVPQEEKIVKENAKETEQGGFTDVPDREIQRKMTEKDNMRVLIGDYRTPRQRQVEKVAELFDVKLRWDSNVSEAYYNFETHCIFMNPELTLSEMYAVVFKHELVHHFELKKGYDGFKNYLFKSSEAFAAYVMYKMSDVNGTDFEGTYEEAIEAYTDYKYDQYKSSTEIPEGLRKRFTVEMAEMEIVADFVGEQLLFGKEADTSINALEELAQIDRNIFQRIWDWMKDTLAKLKKRGDVQDKSVIKDLEYLNKRLARVWDSADKKNYVADEIVKYIIKYPAFSKEDINQNINEVAQMSSVYDVDSGKLEKTGKKPSETFADIFKSWGNNISTEVFGDIAVGKSSVKSEVRHGITAEKIASIEAIPTVINEGKVIFHSRKGEGYADRIVVCAPITIGTDPYIMGVMIQRDAKNQRLYLHNVAIEKETSVSSLDNLVTTGAFEENENLSMTNILQKVLSVKNNSMQKSDKNTADVGNIKHSIGLVKDSGFDAQRRAEIMISRYGEYRTGIDGLKSDLDTLMSYAEKSDWLEVNNMAKSIVENFAGKNGKAVNTDIALKNLYNRVIIEAVNKQTAQKYKDKYEGRLKRESEQRYAKNREIEKLKKEKQTLKEKVGRDENTIRDELEQKRVEREDRKKNLEHFRSTYNKLTTRLEGNTDAKHVPEHLKDLVSSFLKTFKTGNVKVDGKLQRARITAEDISFLMVKYKKAEHNENTGEPNMAYDEDIYEFLEGLMSFAEKSEKGIRTYDLDPFQVMMLTNVADNIWQMVNMADEVFQQDKAVKFKELSSQCIKDLKSHQDKKSVRSNAAAWMNSLKSGSLIPPYFFKHLGEGFYNLYNDVVEGQGKWAVNFNAAKEFVYKIQDKYHYYEWNKKNVVLETERGEKIKLTIEQAMQLYATVKRQLKNKSQDAQHLNIGGIILKDSISDTNWKKIKSDLTDIANDNNLNDAKKASKSEKVWDSFHEKYDGKAVKLSVSDLMKVSELLDEDQKGYADAWVNYLSNNMAALGNETSMQLFGYKKYTEDYYIPYNSAENYLYSQPGVTKGDERLKHLSFTKNTQKKAATPLVLSSLSEVCAAHVDKMCMYNGLAVPLENLNKVFNCTLYDENGSPTENIKNELGRAFGEEAIKYLKRFIDDANGSVRGSGDDSIADIWISRFKKGAVLASMSVVVQQPTAMMRAMAYIDPKYFAHLKDVKGIGKNYEQLCKYAPVALIKQMGRFDTGLGVSNTKWLLEKRYDGVGGKVKGFFTDSQYRDNGLSFLASKADEITWAHIWTAVKAETKAETDLKVGSDEFYQYCGKRFTEVINLTQVYDSTLVKSQHMRDKSAYKKMLTSFMAEPTVTYNMLADALYQRKNGGKTGRMFAKRACGAVLASIVVNTIVKSLVYAARDDDEDKSYIEKYFKALSDSFLQDINPLNLVPFVKDVYSLWQGYDIERADMSLIDELISSLQMLGSENKSFGEKMEGLAGSIANVFGLPLENVIRGIKAAVNSISSIGENDTTVSGVKYAFIEGITGKDSISSYYNRLAEAALDGDEDKYLEIYDYLIENGKKDSEVVSGMKSALKKTDDVVEEAESYVSRLKGNSSYSALDDDDKKAISAKIKEVLSVELLDDMLSGSDAEYDKLYEAKRNDSAKFKELKKKLTDKCASESEINIKLFAAEIRYIESLGIDIHEWALAELAKSKKYADIDGSGSVSKAEKQKAIEDLKVSQKTKKSLWSYYGLD